MNGRRVSIHQARSQLRPTRAIPLPVLVGGALGLGLLVMFAMRPRPVASGGDAGAIPVSAPPVQEALSAAEPVRMSQDGFDWTLTPLARYTLRGVVVHVEDYTFDWNASFAPRDVAMVWGRLVEQDRYRQVQWSQSGRWYYWRYGPDFPFGNDVIAANSSNTHLIPANSNLRAAAQMLRAGDVAELSGELVRMDGVRGGETRWWVSSLSREDQGDGSCEVLWLKRLKVHGRVYQ
ncbi:MAG TPA: hypothetical protein V6D05_10770 [Stenomitos sp.]